MPVTGSCSMLSTRSSNENLPSPRSRSKGEEERGWKSRLLQFAIKLKPTPSGDETHELYWLKEEERAPDWLELFYDLVIVAVLSVFSSAHEVSSPQSVLVYFSYFVIIWWVWASQTMYDVHFQANDWLHRIFKCLQLAAFAFVGATSANFDPFHILPSDEITPEGIQQDSQATSWKGVAIAYAAGRFILVIQYMLVSFRLLFPKLGADLRGQPRHLLWVLFPSAVYTVSGIFWFISAFLTTNASAKLGLAYFGLAIEFLSATLMPVIPGYVKPPASLISERFGALTLVILGEGIIGIVRSFSYVIAGFGFSNDAYLQCFCALIIIFASWHFLFHGFNADRPFKRKSGALWLILHLPLHFVMLLLLAGMKNASVYGNIGDAIGMVITNLQDVITALENNNLDSVQEQNTWLAVNIGKLDVETPYPDELALWNQSFNDPTFLYDPHIEILAYVGDIAQSVADSFGIELSEDVSTAAQSLINLNTTYIFDEAVRNETYAADGEQYDDFLNDYITDLAQGVLFFLPCAGGLVFLSSLLTLLRVAPLGIWMWFAWGSNIVVSIGLCLLGVLDVGNQKYDVDANTEIPAYQLLDASWMLPTVAIAYAMLILIEYNMLLIARRMDPRRHEVETPHFGLYDMEQEPKPMYASRSTSGLEAMDGIPVAHMPPRGL